MILGLTGSNGFTGRYLKNAARLRGHEVYSLKSDLLDANGLIEELQYANVDCLLHLGGLSHQTLYDEKALFSVNVGGTVNLLEAALEAQIDNIVVASSAAVYGATCDRGSVPISENDEIAPTSSYARSKAAMEEVIRSDYSDLGVNITRPFNYVGIGQSSDFFVGKLLNAAKTAGQVKLGSLGVYREFNDVRDVATIYISILEKKLRGEIVNIASGRGILLSEFVDKFDSMLIELGYPELRYSFALELERNNEIIKMVGCPKKLRRILGGEFEFRSMEQTLNWVLS